MGWAKAAALVLGLGLAALGQSVPRSPLQSSGLDHFYNLEYDRAIADFSALTRAEPDSASAWNHLAQAQLYQAMYRMGVLESQLYGHGDPFLESKPKPPDPAETRAFLASQSKAAALAQAEVAAHPESAHAHYDAAVAWALHGNYEFSVKQSYWGALGDAKNARREAEAAAKLDPGFVDPELILGVHNYVAGSLPLAVKMFSTLVGYRGDKEKGRAEIAYVRSHGEHARTDAAVLLAVVDRRDGLNRQAAPVFAQLAADYPRNVLFAVETAEAEEAAGEHDLARAQYQSVLDRAGDGTAGYQHAPLDRVWFGLGSIERVYGRTKAADADFERARSYRDAGH